LNLITPGIYWHLIHGNTPEELAQDEEGLRIMEVQGRNMAWLIKTLEAAGKKSPCRLRLSPGNGRTSSASRLIRQNLL
jgi:hypothetical protein